jgi:hypothetical protein
MTSPLGVPQKPVDHPALLALLKEADYKCQLGYEGCEVTATEAAPCGPLLKAACKNCRRHRLILKARGGALRVKAARRAGR